jgi:hypothetical protein
MGSRARSGCAINNYSFLNKCAEKLRTLPSIRWLRVFDQTTPSAPLRNGNILLMRSHPSLAKEGMKTTPTTEVVRSNLRRCCVQCQLLRGDLVRDYGRIRRCSNSLCSDDLFNLREVKTKPDDLSVFAVLEKYGARAHESFTVFTRRPHTENLIGDTEASPG